MGIPTAGARAIDVSDIYLVETICVAGSLTKAADTLHISQPTLSKRLARLEKQLGTTLFHRGPKGLTPTPIAEYLVDSSGPVKARISSIERQVQRIVAHDLGELRIGVGPIIEQVLLPDVLVKLRKSSGNVRYSVLTDNASVLLSHLRSGKLDVIAGPFGSDGTTLKDEGISSVELIRERTINVVKHNHPILNMEKPNFFDYPYASPPLQGTMESTVEDAPNRPRLVSDNYTLLKKVTLETDYICGGPKAIFQSELDSGEMKEVCELPTTEWRSACLFKVESLETPLVRLFVETISACRDRQK